MTTKPSTAVWADEPYKLMRSDYDHNQNENTHYAITAAAIMASSHNTIIRGMNAILLQGPHIATAQQAGYNEQDLKDFIFYIWAWTKSVDHHHHAEETAIFPLIEKATDSPGLLTDLKEQHKEFHDGLVGLQAYTAVHKEDPKDYRWEEVEKLIKSFGQIMVDHLNGEIEEILALQKFDSKTLQEAWLEAEKVAKNASDLSLLYEVFPVILGGSDKTYEGKNTFPEFPTLLLYAVAYYFSRSYRGAWRYSPCDMWGRPKELYVQPKK